jgi:hypothetical protein
MPALHMKSMWYCIALNSTILPTIFSNGPSEIKWSHLYVNSYRMQNTEWEDCSPSNLKMTDLCNGKS